MKKRFLAILLTLIAAVALLTVGASAAETYVAKIGEVTYTDLHEAMVAAKAGETVVLMNNVDLAGTEWEPVSFKGAFDGQNYTISNLTINKAGVSSTGFITSLNGTFKNVTFTNPTVTGGENTGVVAGRAGGDAALAENITINGTIKVETTHSGYARTGGIVGGWGYGNYKNITVDGGNAADSYIMHSGTGDGRYVAGIVGHADDVESYVNCTVKNITISSTNGGWLCGGIAGPGPADGLASGCSVESIKINADYSGGMFGWYYGDGTIEDSSVKNVEFTAGTTRNGAIGGYSSNPDATVTNVTIENVKNGDAALLEHVAKIGNTYYFDFEAALAAAKDGETVTLIWAEGDDPIAMNGAVYGKTVTITGTALVDWHAGWLFVGRGGEGDGKLIFSNAHLTAGENLGRDIGIHVSGATSDANKNDGTLVITDGSNIELDWLVNRNEVIVDGNSTLAVVAGLNTHGRNAAEAKSGVAQTATLTVEAGSTLTMKNYSITIGGESDGVLNIEGTVNTPNLAVSSIGTVNVTGGTLNVTNTLTNDGTIYVTGTSDIAAAVTGSGWVYMNGVTLDADTVLTGAKVGFINGANTIVGSTIDDGWFSVGLGKGADATAAAAFAEANGITLGDVTVNVSDDAVIGAGGATYAGWIGSAYSADKTVNKYELNVENSLATFGYLHISKDGALNVKGHATNKYTQDGANVDFYAGDFIINGEATFDGTDAWSKFTKMSVDHADGVLNITNGTNYEASIHNGSNTSTSLKFWKAGKINVDAASKVEIDNGTVLVAGAELNIGGDVTAKGAVTGAGKFTLTETAATLTAAEGLTVDTTVGGYAVVYEDGAYKLALIVAKIGETGYTSLQAAIDDAVVNGGTITLLADCAENVTVTQAPDVKITIDGNDKTMTGSITVDGKSACYDTAALTIKNVDFDAAGIATDACINLGVDGDSNTRYTNHVTVEDCTFTDSNNSRAKAAVKSYTGGDKNLIVTGCTVASTMHSLLQVDNVEEGLIIDGCTVNSKNGINLNSSAGVVIKNSTIAVSGYAVRAGVSGGTSGEIDLTNNTLKTDNTEGDAVVVIRGTAAEQIDLTMTENVVSGDIHISGTTANTKVSADANYWDGEAAPTVSGTAVEIASYYTDAALTDLVLVSEDESGNPVYNYEVTFVIPTGATVVSVSGGSAPVDGVYYLSNGTYTVTVSKDGYYDATKEFTVADAAQTVTVELEKIPTAYRITVADAENGTVSTDYKSARAGRKVTVTVAADEKYIVKGLTVTTATGREIAVTDKGDGTYTFTMPGAAVTITAEFGIPFTDIEEDHKFYEAIEWVYTNNLMIGKTETTFDRAADVTRQQVWRVLARVITGEDTDGMAGAKAWAIEQGISDGSRPGEAATREEFITMMWIAFGKADADTSVLEKFSDADAISAEAKTAMAWAVEVGITEGYADGTMRPAATTTRGAFAAVLYRYLSK